MLWCVGVVWDKKCMGGCCTDTNILIIIIFLLEWRNFSCYLSILSVIWKFSVAEIDVLIVSSRWWIYLLLKLVFGESRKEFIQVEVKIFGVLILMRSMIDRIVASFLWVSFWRSNFNEFKRFWSRIAIFTSIFSKFLRHFASSLTLKLVWDEFGIDET